MNILKLQALKTNKCFEHDRVTYLHACYPKNEYVCVCECV